MKEGILIEFTANDLINSFLYSKFNADAQLLRSPLADF